ncbi:MraY family glycosyltransferase [Thermohalobacter berrensis]|uniref:Undecaprenyl-phosphate alpha-N-acetylglucosaminyl 1-phosphate transferase n=1 Tax=Thermohalobacter berrensis TaxID=99594 RepID=A0A419T1Q3_9FIRM|nr:MraY family glycosyltransferase [Thermohalobacter berrensis]RKD31383.1 undecaprenyl-phosphate alpha-N-acetylglucosaminyl 1-phosphate transferase [Thermohalobacter berrensis]
MENYYKVFFTAVSIAYILTPLAKWIANKIGAIDIPKDNRRVHKRPIPRLGGLAIYLATMVSMLIFLPINKTLFSIMIGSTIIVITGIIDDTKSISPKVKLLGQIIAALILIWGDIKIEFITNPFDEADGMMYLKVFAVPVTVFWVVGITNTLNLIDGLDGLAAGVASIAAIFFIFVASSQGIAVAALMSAIIAGACIGFLPHNFNPAKIFMGDTGALFLGYMLSVVAIEGVMKSVAALTIGVPILILGLPIFDTTFAIIRRFLNRKPIMEADKGHLHHRLLEWGLTHRQTVVVLYGISSILGGLAIVLTDMEPSKGVILLGIVLTFILLGASSLGLTETKKQKSNRQG